MHLSAASLGQTTVASQASLSRPLDVHYIPS